MCCLVVRALSVGVAVILEALANPVRAQIVLVLEEGSAKYSDLLQACELDPYSESGKLGYHLQQLISLGLITRDKSRYALTKRGRKASKLMATVKETGEELFETPHDRRKEDFRTEKVSISQADWTDIAGVVELWRASFPGDEAPDYFVAEMIAGREGIKKQALLNEGSGLGRLTYVAKYEGRIIGCCILDRLSLAQMKAEHLAHKDQASLPEELQLGEIEEEEDFRKRYWDAQSRLIATLSSTNYLETKYGVTGTWLTDGEPIKLIFTRKSFADGGYVTADLEEIMEEILWCKKIAKRAKDTLKEEMKATGFGGPPACFEIHQLFIHPSLDKKVVGNMIIEHVENRAANRGIHYIVADLEPDDAESRELFKEREFTEIHQPRFEHRHASRKETCTELKELPTKQPRL